VSGKHLLQQTAREAERRFPIRISLAVPAEP
jgi:hypothetical protein